MLTGLWGDCEGDGERWSVDLGMAHSPDIFDLTCKPGRHPTSVRSTQMEILGAVEKTQDVRFFNVSKEGEAFPLRSRESSSVGGSPKRRANGRSRTAAARLKGSRSTYATHRDVVASVPITNGPGAATSDR
jgi:hypothetical protein